MKDIKTKPLDIRGLDRVAKAKDILVDTKERGENAVKTRDNSPNEYATNRVSEQMENTASRTGSNGVRYLVKGRSGRQADARKIGGTPVDPPPEKRSVKSPQYHSSARYAQRPQKIRIKNPTFRDRAESPQPPAAAHTVPERYRVSAIKTRSNYQSTHVPAGKSGDPVNSPLPSRQIKTRQFSTVGKTRTPDKTVKAVTSQQIKTAPQTIKQGERTIKTVAAGAQPIPQSTRAAAQAAQRTHYTAKQTAKKAADFVQRAAQATINTVRRIIVATQQLVTAIWVGFSVAVAIIVIVGMMGFILFSPLGIFASGDRDSQSQYAMPDIVAELNNAYNAELERLQAPGYDGVVITGAMADWRHVLAIYAISTATPDDGTEVATIDDDKRQLVVDTFWSMNEINHYVEAIEHHDEDDSWTEYILHITMVNYPAQELAELMGFTAEQLEFLDEMLSGYYDSLFDVLINGHGVVGPIGIGMYIWPTNHSKVVTSLFGNRWHPILNKWLSHEGIDIRAAEGTNVFAAAAGTVTTSAYDPAIYGHYIVIDHGDGYSTKYAHLSARSVSVGDSVIQGQIIGRAGNTGMSTGAHLHFETYVRGSRVDPLLYFEDYEISW